MIKFVFVLGIFFIYTNGHGPASLGKRNKLIYILLDGFRYDYVDVQPKKNLPGFNKLLDNGVRAEYMTPIFPSISYPDWMTLVTGLYAESHGIVGNNFYDPEDNSSFILVNSNTTGRRKWWTSEPIWITATKCKVKTAVFDWGRCDITFDDVTPAFCKHFHHVLGYPVFHESIEKVVSKLQEGYDFIMMYNSLTDRVGHEAGPESEEIKTAVKKLDSGIVDLLSSLENMNMKDKVNIIIVSDHGMVQTNQETVNKVELDQYLLEEYVVNVAGSGAFSNIKVKEGHVDEVYNKLKGMPGVEVYKHDDIPEEFHFKNNKYIHDIILKADINTRIMKSTKVQLIPRTNNEVANGKHGFDPREESMRAIFFASGPDFKKKSTIPAIKNVDVYPLLIHLLQVHSNPNNGTFENIKMALAMPTHKHEGTPRHSGAPGITGTLLPLILAMIYQNVC